LNFISKIKALKNNLLFLYALLLGILVLVLNSCSSNNAKQKSNVYLDTVASAPPEPGFNKAIRGIYQDSLLTYLKMLKEIKVNKKAKRPFKHLHYNKVIAYEYQGFVGERVVEIVENSKLASTIKKQSGLNQEQVNNVTALLGANSTYGEGYASCFQPRLGIVFFNDTNIVYHASICLECNRLRSSMEIPATRVKYIEIDDDYKYPAEGFSKTGGQKIVAFFKELKMVKP
jgi:hypothetical protein